MLELVKVFGYKDTHFCIYSFLKKIISIVKIEALLRITLLVFLLGGIVDRTYCKNSLQFNSNGNFIGI